MQTKRLSERKLEIWSQGYLVYKYLWPNIEWAVKKAIGSTRKAMPLVLDIGCGNQPYRDLFRNCSYFGLDHGTDGATPDTIGDAMNLPIAAGSADIVFSTQLIEHLPRPQSLVNEAARVLVRGGFLILTGPCYWPLHEEPRDFYRFTKYGFAHLLREAGFRDCEIREDGGDWAQVFLSIALRFDGPYYAPIRTIVNLSGSMFDRFSKSRKSPSNYTVLATR